jgi:chromosome segregation ATPase
MKNKNYEEKEKRLEDVLLRLSDLTNKFGGNQEDANNLNIQKNHLISEKKIIEEKYQKLLSAHRVLQDRLGNLSKKLEQKFNEESRFDQKVDELNEETDLLISEIDKWEM